MGAESDNQHRYPALSLSDKELLEEILSKLSSSISALADPYSDDGSYAAAIRRMPMGLRAMAATHYLDISLSLDDIGWHFLNFGEPNLVKETESGLRELGLNDLAEWFAEAFEIVNPLRPEIKSGDEYYECLTRHGRMERIRELTQNARDKESGSPDAVLGSPIYAAWIKYARGHPENVFGS